jgi:pantothenate kinase type III
MRRSLTQAAALARIDGGHIVSLARNTADGVASGAALAIAALIDRVATVLHERYGQAACVLTGGTAADIAELVVHGKALIPDLVPKGLAIWAGGER